MSRKRIPPFSEQLRAAIRADERSQYRIAIESGVPKETISRFLHGQVGLRLSSIDALAKVLRLRVVTDDE